MAREAITEVMKRADINRRRSYMVRFVKSRFSRSAFVLALFAGMLAGQRVASAQVTTAHGCNDQPGGGEVYVFEGPQYTGKCAALSVGYCPTFGGGFGGFGLGNDTISSVMVGQNVRARLFGNTHFGGGYQMFGASGRYASMPSGWDNKVSSIRVEDNSRSPACNDLQPGEFVLFGDVQFGNDCIVLKYGGNYPTSDDMGIANDSISSVNGGPLYFAPCPPNSEGTWGANFYVDANYQHLFGGTQSGDSPNTTESLGGFKDTMSSISTSYTCWQTGP